MDSQKKHRRVLFKSRIMSLDTEYTHVVGIKPEIYYFYIAKKDKLIDVNEIEATRVAVTRELRRLKVLSKKKKNFRMNIHFFLPYTKKSAQSRMGKGKGGIIKYRAYVHLNTIVCELRYVSEDVAIKLKPLIERKLSFPVDLCVMEDGLVSIIE